MCTLSSCQEPGREEEQLPASFELKSTEVNITAEGGQASMPYTLENPIDSLKVVAESEAGWLGRFEDNGSEIMFFVDPNEEASSRSAEVTAVYGDIVQTFTVNQDGAVGPFSFNVKEIGYDHIIYDVIPEDKEMTYISYVIHSNYAGWDPDDTDAYIYDELEWYSFVAGGNLSAYLEGIALKGDATDLVADGLEAEARALYPYRTLNALQTVGYREFFDYFDGKISRDEAIELIKRNTRRYAKRQMTWFSKDKKINWLGTDVNNFYNFLNKKFAD